jgi:hypothetical protein
MAANLLAGLHPDYVSIVPQPAPLAVANLIVQKLTVANLTAVQLSAANPMAANLLAGLHPDYVSIVPQLAPLAVANLIVQQLPVANPTAVQLSAANPTAANLTAVQLSAANPMAGLLPDVLFVFCIDLLWTIHEMLPLRDMPRRHLPLCCISYRRPLGNLPRTRGICQYTSLELIF